MMLKWELQAPGGLILTGGFFLTLHTEEMSSCVNSQTLWICS